MGDSEDTERDTIPAASGVEPEPPPGGTKACPGCGTINEAASNYCYRCGLRLPEEALPAARAWGSPAGFWVRLFAFLLDQVLLSVVGIAITLLATDLTFQELLARIFDPAAPFPQSQYFITLALEAGYFTICIGAWGRTAGKALLGVKVVRLDGSAPGYGRSFARYLAYYISWFTLGLGFLMIALNAQKRGLHDLVCDTRVIRT